MSQLYEKYLKEAINKSYRYIKNQLIFTEIIDHLYEKQVVTIEEKRELDTIQLGEMTKTGKLLDLILMKENDNVVKFVEILKSTQEHLYQHIMDAVKSITGAKTCKDESDNFDCSTVNSDAPDGDVSAKIKSAVPVEVSDAPENIVSSTMKFDVPSEVPVGISAVPENVPDSDGEEEVLPKGIPDSGPQPDAACDDNTSVKKRTSAAKSSASRMTSKREQLAIANKLLNTDDAKDILTNVDMVAFFNKLAEGVVAENTRVLIINENKVNEAVAKHDFVKALKSSMHHDKINLICEALEKSGQGPIAEHLRDLQQN